MYQLISKYKSLLVIFTFTNDDGVIFAGDCTNEVFVMDVCVCDQFTKAARQISDTVAHIPTRLTSSTD